jgi:hypothetical protein
MLRRIAYLAAFVFLAAVALLFTALNPQRFDIDIGVTRFEMSAGLALLIAFAGGLLAGAAWRADWIARLLAERGRLRHALRLAESRRSPQAQPAAAPPGDVA